MKIEHYLLAADTFYKSSGPKSFPDGVRQRF